MICKPHSNNRNYARADLRTIARNIKWPVKYGQNTVRKNQVGQNAHILFLSQKIEICDQPLV